MLHYGLVCKFAFSSLNLTTYLNLIPKVFNDIYEVLTIEINLFGANLRQYSTTIYK